MLRLRLTQPWSRAPNRRSNSRCGISSGGSGRLAPAQLMFFCTAPPNDSWETPICSERNRDSPPILRASIWSSEGPPGPFEVSRVQVISAHSDCGCPLPPYVIVEPAQHQDVVLAGGRSESGRA